VLLIRDLAQVASPAGRAAPLRGAALGEVDVVEDAYVVCDGDTIRAVGRMRDLAPVDGDVVEITTEASGDALRVGIHDRGPGIPETFRANFFRIDRATSEFSALFPTRADPPDFHVGSAFGRFRVADGTGLE